MTGRSGRGRWLAGAARAAGRAAVDVGLPVAVALLLLAVVQDGHRSLPGWLLGAAGAVAAAQGLVLFWRRSHPRIVMAATVAGAAAVQLAAPGGLLPYAGLVALWALAAAGPPRASLVGLVGLLAVTALNAGTAPAGDTQFALAIVVTVWALGEATRSRLVAGEQAARRAVAQEQARLAREVHDVVAHSVSVMVVQAAAADDVFEARPEAARAALRSVEATGREALAELRRVLAAIGTPEDERSHRPAPGLDRLDDLVRPLRELGLTVDVRHWADPGVSVPPAVGLSAYRIVQEALTNTVRHARATHVDVVVNAARSGLELAVVDDGGGADGGGDGAHRGRGGRGIPGMCERAALLGGTLEAGPGPDGGFRVRVLIPLPGPS